MNISATSTAFSGLGIVLQSLKVGVGVWCAQLLLPQDLAMMLYRHLCTVACRMARLIARFEAGLLPTRARRPRVQAAPAEPTGGAPGVARIWPNRFAWLVLRVSWRASCLGGQLRTVLAQPDMQALLAASPDAVRVLAPLCRMLAIEPFVWQPGVVETPAAEAEIKTKKIRAPGVPVDWGRIPLPRGLLTAARKRGFKSG